MPAVLREMGGEKRKGKGSKSGGGLLGKALSRGGRGVVPVAPLVSSRAATIHGGGISAESREKAVEALNRALCGDGADGSGGPAAGKFTHNLCRACVSGAVSEQIACDSSRGGQLRRRRRGTNCQPLIVNFPLSFCVSWCFDDEMMEMDRRLARSLTA